DDQHPHVDAGLVEHAAEAAGQEVRVVVAGDDDADGRRPGTRRHQVLRAAMSITPTTWSWSASVRSWNSGRIRQSRGRRSGAGIAARASPAYAGSRGAAMIPRRALTPWAASVASSSSRETGKVAGRHTQNDWKLVVPPTGSAAVTAAARPGTSASISW